MYIILHTGTFEGGKLNVQTHQAPSKTQTIVNTV